MPDAQNFSYKPLAVTFVKVQHLYFIKKAFGELYQVTPFPVVHSMDVEVTLIIILFPYKQKSESTLLVLLWLITQ